MSSTEAVELWETIARDAVAESPIWGEALRPESEREREAVFSPLAEERFALGLETIYEGYLVHYGTPRLFAPVDEDTALLRIDGDSPWQVTGRQGVSVFGPDGEVRHATGETGPILPA